MLENGYLQSVGSKFTPTMELQEFLDKYEVDLPILDAEFGYMDDEFSIDEVKTAYKMLRRILLQVLLGSLLLFLNIFFL